jgi:hypothetical protein
MKTTFACMLAFAALGGAQAPVPTRSLGPVVATSQPLARVNEIRQLADGRVLVNDGGSRQLLLFDSSLKTSKVVLDSTGPQDRRYGATGSLIRYIGDTTLFLDSRASALLVLDGNANVVRVVAAPSGRGLEALCMLYRGTPQCTPTSSGVDTKGRLVFFQSGSRSSLPTDTGIMRMTVRAAYFVGYDLARRTTDTVFTLRSDTTYAPWPGRGARPAAPAPAFRPTPLPLFGAPTDHVVMSDGTIAVVRGDDYHIDWIGADGTAVRSPRIAHEWKPLTDDDKKRMADSLTVLRDSSNKAQLASLAARMAANPSLNYTPMYDATGRIVGGSGSSVSSVGGRAVAPRPLPPPPPEALVPVPADALPNYMPAIQPGTLADADNRLWIPLSYTMLPPDTRVFDIVDRSGKLVDRVSVEPSHQIIGVGPGGNVFLIVYDGGVGRLQRVRFR